ncbi:hypothetical protein RF11_09502 [Thelohanellus kitauei]|uniref:Uncharacterized protein n=1 Tax=Thelohanellus kitauei TaxID=669202 RepID=A0A0C2MRF2_THEKT|nr:hypothetical protein RF11_09502 [Thelohanellus kitauei]
MSYNLIYAIKLSGWKIEFSGYNISSGFKNPILYYDKRWTNVTLQITIEDVFWGISEIIYVDLQNHTPSYTNPKNRMIITNMKYIPVPSPETVTDKYNNFKYRYAINKYNTIPLLVHNQTFQKVAINNDVKI